MACFKEDTVKMDIGLEMARVKFMRMECMSAGEGIAADARARG